MPDEVIITGQQTREQRDALLQQIRERDGGMLRRDAEVVGVVDREARTVEVAFSSEIVVRRWFGDEVLSHDPAHVRMGRLQDGAAVLWGHDWHDMRGVVESARIDADGKGRALLRFSRNPDGEALMNDVDDRIVRNISVGYFVHDFVVREVDGRDRYVLTDWEPYEISFVSVPADVSVGVGRSAEIPREETAPPAAETADTSEVSVSTTREQATMPDPINTELQERERAAGTDAERNRVRAINNLAARFGNAADDVAGMARAAVDNGDTPEQFQSKLLEGMEKRAARPLNDTAGSGDIGMSSQEVRSFSLLRVVRALANPTDAAAQRAAAFEFEVSEAARANQANGDTERFVIPTDVLRRSVYGETGGQFERAPWSTTTGGGGNTIATTLMAASFIDILRARATALQLGTVMGGLQGNIDIPKQVSGAQGYWLGEDVDATETGVTVGMVSMSPKTVGAFTELTRRLAMQSSLDVEAMLRRDLAVALALTIDTACYYGPAGSATTPMGVNNLTGINAKVFAGVQPTFAELVDMETQVALDNADVGSMAYIANAAFRGHAKTTPKFANTDATLWEPGGTVNGYRSEITNQIVTGDVFLGNWADMLIGMWGGLELTVDPFSGSKSGRTRLVVFQDVDTAFRRAESFCVGRDAAP